MSGARPGDGDVIEIVDADPTVFGGVVMAPRPTPEPRGPRPDWFLPFIGSILSIALLTFVVAAWSPWHAFEERPWSNRLVLGAVTEGPSQSYVDGVTNPPTVPLDGATASVGVVFAAPGARPNVGTWATFQSGADGSTQPDDSLQSVTIGDAHGTLAHNGDYIFVRWNDGAGAFDWLTLHGLNDDQSLRLARALSVKAGKVLVSDHGALGDMRMIASLDEATTVLGLLNSYSGFAPGSKGLTSVHYSGTVGGVVASIPGPVTHWLDLLTFLVGTPTAHTVRHHRAAVAPISPENHQVGAVVWPERGRLIMVMASDIAASLKLAESVREATDAEWKQVLAVQQANG